MGEKAEDYAVRRSARLARLSELAKLAEPSPPAVFGATASGEPLPRRPEPTPAQPAMSSAGVVLASDKIEFILRTKFPQSWAPPTLQPLRPYGSGARNPIAQNMERHRQLMADIQTVRAELVGLPMAELEAVYLQAATDATVRASWREEYEESKRPFNRPDAIAGPAVFAHWAKSEYWTIDEALALLWGRNPKIVTWTVVSGFTRVSKFAKEYEDVRSLALRSAALGGSPRINPHTAIGWARGINHQVPDGLAEALAQRPTLVSEIDWGHWRRMPAVDPWIACALSLNQNPDKMKLDPRTLFQDQSKPVFTQESFLNSADQIALEKRMELLQASLDDKQYFTGISKYRLIHPAKVKLSEFAAWCLAMDLDGVPQQLLARVNPPMQAAQAPAAEVVGDARTSIGQAGDAMPAASASLKPAVLPSQPVIVEPNASTPTFSMTKTALIAAHEHEWPTIRRNLQDASQNGLDAAKAGARDWNENVALAWARSKGKLIGATKPANELSQAVHSMANLPGRKHTL